MELDYALHIIYYILLIIVLLVVLLLLLRPNFFTEFGSTKVEDVDIVDSDDEDNVINNNEQQSYSSPDFEDYKVKFNFKKFDHIFTLAGPIESADEIITYADFLELIEDDEFIDDYRESLLRSFEDKKTLYTELLKNADNDLKSSPTANSGGITGMHDSNVEMLKVYRTEIQTILNILNKRIKSINNQVIKTNFKKIINHKKYGLRKLIGRENVKDFIALQIYTFSRNHNIFLKNFQNIAIYGGSGIGKSKVAMTLSYVFAKSFILLRQKFRMYTKKDLTSSYVNESQRLTFKLLLANLEGISFFDEAYEIGKSGIGTDHGSEAITELVNFTDKYVGLSIVIVAGYQGRMEAEFMAANQGLPSRFPNVMILSDYTPAQLNEILIDFIESNDKDITISQKDANCLYTVVDYLYTTCKQTIFEQARSMLHLSQNILSAIYSSKNYEWGSDRGSNNVHLILLGVNMYLRKYNISISA